MMVDELEMLMREAELMALEKLEMQKMVDEAHPPQRGQAMQGKGKASILAQSTQLLRAQQLPLSTPVEYWYNV